MVSAAIPEILYKQWFWLPIAVGLTVISLFIKRKSPPPSPRVGKFLAKHKRHIIKINDILLLCIVLLWFPFLMIDSLIDSVRDAFGSLSAPEPRRTMLLQSHLMFLFTLLIFWSGTSGLLVGFLSFFQSNLTKTKRIILLVVCLLPVAFTVFQIVTDFTENTWLIIQLCFYCSAGSWIINAPAIITGSHFFTISSNTVRKAKLAFRNYFA